jgi:uncharacterized short protein YbdD (DUF466 family)
MRRAQDILAQIWQIAREVFGDKAYDRYAAHARGRGETPLTPQEFYVSQLQRKYSRPSRCC